jgi:ubiquitin-protein ligase
MLSKEKWKITYTILILLNGIIRMLHAPPEVNDPATTSLLKYVQKPEGKYQQPNLSEYFNFLRNQAKRFRNRYEDEI